MSSLREKLNATAKAVASEQGQNPAQDAAHQANVADKQPSKSNRGKPEKKEIPSQGPTPRFVYKDGVLDLEFKTYVDDQPFTSAAIILDSEATQYLGELLRPLAKLANAVTNRKLGALKSQGYERVKDEHGRPTKELAKDDNGKPIKILSPVDIAKTVYADMLATPGVKELLKELNQRLIGTKAAAEEYYNNNNSSKDTSEGKLSTSGTSGPASAGPR